MDAEAVEAPEDRIICPPTPLLVEPTYTDTEPGAPVAAPVPMRMRPDAPVAAVPLLNTRVPEEPTPADVPDTMVTEPVVPVAPATTAPDTRDMEPLVPVRATPLKKDTGPELPDHAVPEEKRTEPLTPELAAELVERMVTPPVEVDDEPPLVMYTLPPEARRAVDWPASMTRLPEGAPLAEPMVREMEPPAPPVLWPATSVMPPALPLTAFPVLSSSWPTEPVPATDPVVMLMPPLMAAEAPVPKYRSPLRPKPPVPVAKPLPTNTRPVLPTAAVPPLNSSWPDTPVTASALRTLTMPELVVAPAAVMLTEPPVAVPTRPEPVTNTMLPPV